MHLKQLAAKLREAFPTAEFDKPVELMGEGFGSLVAATAGGLIIRIAKHAAAKCGQQRERRLLPVLRQHDRGLQIPNIPFALESTVAFPFGVIGYPPIDLDTQGYLGERFAQAVIVAYSRRQAPPADLGRRIALLMGPRELPGLEHGMMVGNVDAESVEKVKAALAAER